MDEKGVYWLQGGGKKRIKPTTWPGEKEDRSTLTSSRRVCFFFFGRGESGKNRTPGWVTGGEWINPKEKGGSLCLPKGIVTNEGVYLEKKKKKRGAASREKRNHARCKTRRRGGVIDEAEKGRGGLSVKTVGGRRRVGGGKRTTKEREKRAGRGIREKLFALERKKNAKVT